MVSMPHKAYRFLTTTDKLESEASTPVGGAGLSGSFAKSIEQTLSSGKSQEIQSFYLFHEV